MERHIFYFVLLVIFISNILGIFCYRNRGNQNVDMEKQESPASSQCDDVAIIGAGASGSYAAWRLRHRNLKISMYEYSNRIGGRCYTVQLPGIPDVNVEMGPMRFLPEDHPLTNKTAYDLGLNVVDFKLGYGPFQDSLYYLRGNHIQYKDLPKIAPYNIPSQHRIDLKVLNWKVYTNFTYTDQNGALKSIDRVPLKEQSWDMYMNKFLDTETIQYIRDSSGFKSWYGPEVAAEEGIPRDYPRTKDVKTVTEGFQAFPESMVKDFLLASKQHKFNYNHHLRSIRKDFYGNYVLSFQPTQTIKGITRDIKNSPAIKTCAKTVLLAIPKLGLENLDWAGLRQQKIQHYLKNSLKTVLASKIYFGYSNDWWRHLPLASVYAVSMTPLRQTYDYGVCNTTSKGVLNTAYTDADTKLWKEAVTTGNLVPGFGDNHFRMTDKSVDLARKFYAEIFNVPLAKIPQPSSAILSVFDMYPIGASWYTWRPGYDWDEVEACMTKPSASDDVYIVGNIFSASAQSDWIEGGMKIVEKVIKLI